MKKIFLLMILILVSACKIETGTDESSRFQVYNYSQVDFATLKDKVLQPQCSQCHSWATNENEIIKRIIPGDPANSALYKSVKSGQMPSGKPRLTDQALKLVEQYISHVDSARAVKPVPLAATYASLKVNLFEKSCVGCHNPDDIARRPKPKRLLLTSKESIVEDFENVLFRMSDQAWEQLDNEMPPSTSKTPRVSPEVIKMFEKWAADGFPD